MTFDLDIGLLVSLTLSRTVNIQGIRWKIS